MASAHLVVKYDYQEQSQPLIDDYTQKIIVNALFICVGSIASLFGVCTNVFNIVVYVKQGMNDSVTVLFFTLSVLDWAICILGLTTSICVIVGQVKPMAVDHFSFVYCLGQVREKVYAMSVTIIFLVSVERSFCVAFPFTVKLIFTKSRSIKVIVCISIAFLALLVPEYLTHGLAWTYDKRINATRLLLWVSPDRSDLEVFKNSVLAGLLPVLTGVAATICSLYIISALRSSNTFQQSAAARKHPDISLINADVHNGVIPSTAKTRLSGSDVRAATTVVVIDAMFVVCNLPKFVVLAFSIVALYIPEFSRLFPGKYTILVILFVTITYTIETINSACSFLIYYASSTKFRATFLSLFSRY